MLRIRGLRGNRLLHALSTHFDLTEMKVTANGRVQTRLYQKFGLHIREQVQLPPAEDRTGSAANGSPEEEVFEPDGWPSSGLMNLAEAMQPSDRRSATVLE